MRSRGAVILGGVAVVAVLGTAVFLFFPSRVLELRSQNLPLIPEQSESPRGEEAPSGVGATGSATTTTSSSLLVSTPSSSLVTIPPQERLSKPPQTVRAIYLTGWSAGSDRKLKEIIPFMQKNNLNGVVVDVKDYSGYVSYVTGIEEVKASGAEAQLRILEPHKMIKMFHDAGIYVIARITVFQDPILAAARPEWALKDKNTGKTWKDRKGLSWLDPAAKGVWDYHVALAKDATARGFDEINFDYIRFPSDGDLKAIQYPFWEDLKITRREAMRNFFSYLRESLPGIVISADVFGLTTVSTGDLGIGQELHDVYPYFDYVCPMIYPSHYAKGYLGYANPAEAPYEVILSSMEGAALKRDALLNSSTTPTVSLAKIRPWLQVFDLGAVYDREKVELQIKAVDEVLNGSKGRENVGWLLWDPRNLYNSYR